MYTTTPNSANLIPSTWAFDAIRDVRNALQAEGRDELALKLSEALGGLTPAASRLDKSIQTEARHLDDAGPDYEDSAELDVDDDGVMWLDFSRSEEYEAMAALASGFDLEVDDTRVKLGHCDDMGLPAPCSGFKARWDRLADQWERDEADRRREAFPRGAF